MSNIRFDPLKEIFFDFLDREKQIIFDYWTNAAHTVFFRANADRNQTNDNITCFATVEDALTIGRLMSVFDVPYLVLNSETVENSVYRKSDLVRCNILLDSHTDGYEIVLPAYAKNQTDLFSDGNKTINVVSGDAEIITEHNAVSDKLRPNSYFNSMGGRYKITNRLMVENILHIFAQRETDAEPSTYTFSIVSDSNYPVDTSKKFNAVAKRTEGIVNNASIIWSSSDDSIVSITNDGIATFITPGVATITAHWKEHNISDEKAIEIVDVSPTLECAITFTGAAEVKAGGSVKIFAANFFDANGNVNTSIVPVWNVELLPVHQGKVIVTEQVGSTIKLQANISAPTNTNFNLHLSDAAGSYSTMISIAIVSLF